MKTFKDLEFKKHPLMDGVYASITFANGYGARVVRGEFSHGGKAGLYELAVLNSDDVLTYDTPISKDVLGFLTDRDITEVLIKIQQL